MGWIANVLFVLGVCALGGRRRVGFIINATANALYACVGWQHSLYDLLGISLVLTGINLWSWMKWGREHA